MKTLIIGAGGFVGGYLIDAIKELLYTDICVTKLEHHNLNRNDVSVVNLNILDYEQVKNVLLEYQPYYIFYLVAKSSVSRSWSDSVSTVQTNINGSLNLMNAIRECELDAKVLIIGSAEEYGLIEYDEVPIVEDTLLRPGNIYAATKACQNMLGTIYSKTYGIKTIMVRAFNHIGPKQADTFVVSDFCKQAILIEKNLQEPVIRVGNLQAIRDFTDVRDVVEAYVRLIQFGEVGKTYNVGSGNAVKISDVLDLILKNTDKKINVEIDKNKLRPIDIPVIQADISKINGATGWKPQIPLEQTIVDMLNYYRETL